MFCFLATAVLAAADVYQAIAVLSPLISSGNGIVGNVKFSFTGTTLTVKVNVSGITLNPDGKHGMHIHETGDLRGIIDKSGGLPLNSHFNPDNSNHACPDLNSTWHAGDLGNWDAVAGSIIQEKTFTTTSDMMKGSNFSIIGRAVVLHGRQDDCFSTGSSQERLAAGVIGVQNNSPINSNKAASSYVSRGVCVLQGTSLCTGAYCNIGNTGLVTLSDSNTGVLIQAEVKGLSTERGFHVHEFGDLSSSDGSSAGLHYNPTVVTHGLPPSDSRHVGDLGTFKTFDAAGAYYQFTPSFTSSLLRVSDFLGRALVIHQLIDHGLPVSCNGAPGASTGAAGSRIYWCVVGVASTNASLPVPTIPSALSYPTAWTETPCVTSTPTPASTTTSASTSTTSSTTSIGLSLFLLVAALSALVF